MNLREFGNIIAFEVAPEPYQSQYEVGRIYDFLNQRRFEFTNFDPIDFIIKEFFILNNIRNNPAGILESIIIKNSFDDYTELPSLYREFYDLMRAFIALNPDAKAVSFFLEKITCIVIKNIYGGSTITNTKFRHKNGKPKFKPIQGPKYIDYDGVERRHEEVDILSFEWTKNSNSLIECKSSTEMLKKEVSHIHEFYIFICDLLNGESSENFQIIYSVPADRSNFFSDITRNLDKKYPVFTLELRQWHNGVTSI